MGHILLTDDENWPLRFTGVNVSGGMTVKGVKSIKLIRIVVPPAEGQLKVTSTPGGAKIFINGIDTNNVTPYTFTKAPGDYPVYVTLSGYVTPVSCHCNSCIKPVDDQGLCPGCSTPGRGTAESDFNPGRSEDLH